MIPQISQKHPAISMADSKSDPPPAYQSEDSNAGPSNSSNPKAAELNTPKTSTQNAISKNTTKILQIFHSKSTGLDIKLNDRQIYHINLHGNRKTSGMTLYGGYDAHGPQLAASKFSLGTSEEDFDIFVGGQYSNPSDREADKVRAGSEGWGVNRAFYRFETQVGGVGGERRKFFWQKTNDSRLGSSVFAVRDFKLVDAVSDEVVAVYHEASMSWSKSSPTLKGEVKVFEELGEVGEAAALLVLSTVLYRRNEDWKDIGRIAGRWNN